MADARVNTQAATQEVPRRAKSCHGWPNTQLSCFSGLGLHRLGQRPGAVLPGLDGWRPQCPFPLQRLLCGKSFGLATLAASALVSGQGPLLPPWLFLSLAASGLDAAREGRGLSKGKLLGSNPFCAAVVCIRLAVLAGAAQPQAPKGNYEAGAAIDAQGMGVCA